MHLKFDTPQVYQPLCLLMIVKLRYPLTSVQKRTTTSMLKIKKNSFFLLFFKKLTQSSHLRKKKKKKSGRNDKIKSFARVTNIQGNL